MKNVKLKRPLTNDELMKAIQLWSAFNLAKDRESIRVKFSVKTVRFTGEEVFTRPVVEIYED